MYHKAEKIDKCVDACDELILWFGDGPYVERALELKMLYQPLNKQQEEKYRRFRQEKDGVLHISSMEMGHGGVNAKDDVIIPPVEVNTGKFNTVNLQQEIVKGMQQIMSATEQSTVSDTMVNIKRITEEIPYLQIAKETSGMEELGTEYGHIETDEEIDDALKLNFQEMLEEDSDGQISMVTSDTMALERQITGQITIQDVLDDWDRTRRVAETVLYDAQQRKLESAKARALQEAEELMDRLNTVIPKLDAGITPKELLEEEYLNNASEKKTNEVFSQEVVEEEEVPGDEIPVDGQLINEVDEGGDLLVEDVSESETLTDDVEGITAEEIPIPEEAKVAAPPIVFPKIEPIRLQKAPQILSPQMKVELEKTMKSPAEEIAQEMDETLEQEDVSEEKSTEDIVELKDIVVDLNDVADRSIEEELDAAVDESLEKSSLEESTDEAFEKEKLEETDSFMEEDLVKEKLPKENLPKAKLMEENFAKEISMEENLVEGDVSKEDSVEEKKVSLDSTRKMPSWKEFEKERFMRQKTSSIPEIPLPEDLDLFEDDPDKTVYESLTDKQKSIFSYFVPVKGMEDQLCKALTGMTNHLRRREAATSGNLIITGEQGCGKTVLATSILKVLQEETGFLTGKVGKIDASSLNQKDIKDVVEKVKGGCLIIEKAGDLNQAIGTSDGERYK